MHSTKNWNLHYTSTVAIEEQSSSQKLDSHDHKLNLFNRSITLNYKSCSQYMYILLSLFKLKIATEKIMGVNSCTMNKVCMVFMWLQFNNNFLTTQQKNTLYM